MKIIQVATRALGLVALAGMLAGWDGGSSPGVRGSLNKEVIRRVIRGRINDVKFCYQQQLTSNPLLAGKVMVNFTIAASGAVIASMVQSSTMNEPRVENCIVQGMRRWQFPEPVGGGSLMVSYPFVLTPAPIPILGALNAAGAVEIDALDAKLFVHKSQDAHGVPANGIIARTERGLVLIDTGWTEPQTEAILRWGEEKLGHHWIGAVITHDHGDRAGGVGALLRRKIPVAALDLTVAKLAQRKIHGVTTLFTAKAGTFDDPRGFQAFYPGRGHASDNIVIAFRSQNVVFGGCLIKSANAEDLGFTGDADLASWPAAVRRVQEKYRGMEVVPGHGPVVRESSAYERTLALLSAASANAVQKNARTPGTPGSGPK